MKAAGFVLFAALMLAYTVGLMLVCVALAVTDGLWRAADLAQTVWKQWLIEVRKEYDKLTPEKFN